MSLLESQERQTEKGILLCYFLFNAFDFFYLGLLKHLLDKVVLETSNRAYHQEENIQNNNNM